MIDSFTYISKLSIAVETLTIITEHFQIIIVVQTFITENFQMTHNYHRLNPLFFLSTRQVKQYNCFFVTVWQLFMSSTL